MQHGGLSTQSAREGIALSTEIAHIERKKERNKEMKVKKK
jgi:hypothetical protein